MAMPVLSDSAAAGNFRHLRFHRDWLRDCGWPAAGLILAVWLLYAPSIGYQFLNWDDSWYILWNDLIKSWHPANLYQIMTEPVARNYAPATIGSFLVEHTLWQLWPGGYHVTNILLHAINAVLVLQLLRQLTKNDWWAWSVAALFAVHPLQVESVAWISSRKTLLSATFMLASFLCWLRTERSSRAEVWGCVWLLLGLLSKASSVVVPPIVIAYDVLVARKKLADSVSRQVLPLFFCVMLILITMQAQVTIVGGVRHHIGLNKFYLLGIDATLLWRYVGMLLWPRDLCVLYDPPIHGVALEIALAALGWGLVAWGAWKVRSQQPLLTLAAISWLLLLLPVLNLFPLTTLMNDRYLYLPCVPFFAALAGLLQAGWKVAISRVPRREQLTTLAATAAVTLAVGISSWMTLNYLPVWKDPLALWSYAREHTPSLAVVQIQWAITLEDLGRAREAAAALHYALDHCRPDIPDRERIQAMLQRLETSAGFSSSAAN